MTDTPRLLLGTTKGAFILEGSPDRRNWRVRGPFCEGWPINHVLGDPATGTIWAAGGSGWHGAGVWRTTDNGETWSLFSTGIEAETLWSLGRAGKTVLAGAKPATLFASHDMGASWERVEGLSNHPTRADWQPGAAGLVLHSIVSDPSDPDRLWVGISAAGIFATEDGGKTWEQRNRLSNLAKFDHHDHNHGPEVGSCVHNLGRANGSGDLMYQQNHHGVFRSRDGGRTWDSIEDGLPSTFGFPIALHPSDPQTIWVFPLNGDSLGRFPPDAKAAVWRSRDGGDSWQPMTAGLPAADCFFTVLRQGMATDRASPCGVFFGTNSGSVFASIDEGDSWTEIARHLPTILSVESL